MTDALCRFAQALLVALATFGATAETFADEADHAGAPPLALYLTWQRDPTTTMTIHWHTGQVAGSSVVEYGSTDEGARTYRVRGSSRALPFSDRLVHTVELTGLQPGAGYRFRIIRRGEDESSGWYTFRTLPAETDRPIRFAVGGDVMHRGGWMERTNRQAMRFDVDFIIWGGDLAYADGAADRVERWYTFFDAYQKTLISEAGRVVPVVFAIGNHEVVGGYYWREDRGRDAYEDTNAFRNSIAPYFYSLFAFPGHPGYGVLDFGDYLSLIVLDSDHSGPVEGAQTQWLSERLAQRGEFAHVIPVYHVPAFPSVRDYAGGVATRVRENWAPLFEKHGVRIAFEHHDHAYKRTVPIREEQEDPDGVVYIGDGAWGVDVREVHDVSETWYLARAESVRHFILVTLQGDRLDLKVINEDGDLIDHYIPRAAAVLAD